MSLSAGQRVALQHGLALQEIAALQVRVEQLEAELATLKAPKPRARGK